MSSTILTKAGLQIFEKHLKQYEPVDPVWETWVDENGKTHKRKRELPPGLSKRDAKILRKVKNRAHRLDKGFRICGMRFGWTFVIGIIPGVGDVADAVLNYTLVIRKAKQAEIPDWLLHRMLLHNAFSAGVGLVPLVGDVAVAAFKANSRNAVLLEEFLRIRGEEFLKNPKAQAEGSGEGHGKHGENRKGKSMPKEDLETVKPGAGMHQDDDAGKKSKI
ncbi:hypothetical protein ACEPAG_7503 [Sanghuangporus baumii]